MGLPYKIQVKSIWDFQDLESHDKKWDRIEDQNI